MIPRSFLLSPANLGGARAKALLSPTANFDLARRLQAGDPVTLGEVFCFVSSLYFRGKLSYAAAFAQPREGVEPVLVITPSNGLRPPSEKVTLAGLRRWAGISIDLEEARYTRPMLRDARRLAETLASHPEAELVLLGSIASTKYVELLQPSLGPWLRFPSCFVGRGDMSRGSLLLSAVTEGRPLDYARLVGALRHGPRPPRLRTRAVSHR